MQQSAVQIQRQGDGKTLMSSPSHSLLRLDIFIKNKQKRINGEGFSVQHHRLSLCQDKFHNPTMLGLLYMDQIFSNLNRQVGKALEQKKTSIQGHEVAYHRDSRTKYLFLTANRRMNRDAAVQYCRSRGMHLPTIRNQLDVLRLLPLMAITSDAWLNATDVRKNGDWFSYRNQNEHLNYTPFPKTSWEDHLSNNV